MNRKGAATAAGPAASRYPCLNEKETRGHGLRNLRFCTAAARAIAASGEVNELMYAFLQQQSRSM